MPASASRGTSCFGETDAFSGDLSTASTVATSAELSAFDGACFGPQRRSSPGPFFHRSTVRPEIPATAQAACSLAPFVRASSTAATISSRCSRPCRRPRPPTGPRLFFENQERRCFRQRLLLSRQLSLELPDPLRRRDRGPAFLVERQPPLLELPEQ